MPPRRIRAAVFLLAAAMAVSIAYDLWRMPVQVWDALGEILAAQGYPSVGGAFNAAIGTSAYFRPLRIAQIKGLFDLAQGSQFHLVYRGFHALLLLALVLSFAAALRVQSRTDGAAAAFALLVLTGLHTFLSFVREAFPINHFLEIAVLTLVALNLALSRGGWWVDLLAAVVFTVASLTLESGLLVWVVLVAARTCGCRGVSNRGLVAVTLLLAGYMGVRFFYLHTGAPTLAERSSGFWLERLEPDDLERRFGAAPWVFWAYNVVTSGLSVLFSEPREGVFEAVRAWKNGDMHPRLYVWLFSSIGTTALMFWAAFAHRRPSQWGHAERLFFIAATVLAANAVLSFAYTKDDIVSVAGTFYALAAYAAVRAVLLRGSSLRPLGVAALAVMLLSLGGAWAMRSLGVHHVIVTQAFNSRNDWARAPVAWRAEHGWPTEPAALAVIDRLRQDALLAEVPNPQLLPSWRDRWWGEK